jgi:hypothetical protein
MATDVLLFVQAASFTPIIDIAISSQAARSTNVMAFGWTSIYVAGKKTFRHPQMLPRTCTRRRTILDHEVGRIVLVETRLCER